MVHLRHNYQNHKCLRSKRIWHIWFLPIYRTRHQHLFELLRTLHQRVELARKSCRYNKLLSSLYNTTIKLRNPNADCIVLKPPNIQVLTPGVALNKVGVSTSTKSHRCTRNSRIAANICDRTRMFRCISGNRRSK